MKKKIIKYGIRVIAVIICFAVIVTVVKSVQNKSQQFGTKDTVKYTEGLEELSLSDGAVLENENLALYVDENYCISLLDKKQLHSRRNAEEFQCFKRCRRISLQYYLFG